MLEAIDQVHLVAGYRVWRPVPIWARCLHAGWRALVRVLVGIPLEPLHCWLGREGWRRRLRTRWLHGVRVHDVDCSFRLFRREVFGRIPIQSDSAFANVEVLAKANFLGHWMTQAPVTYCPSAAGTTVVDAHDPARSRLEARLLFRRPDFGPPFLEGPTAPPAADLPSTDAGLPPAGPDKQPV
jgi:hypothetical protein